jgi:trigger factor
MPPGLAVCSPETAVCTPVPTVCWRVLRLEGKTLSSTDAVENNSPSEAAQATETSPDHGQEGHVHGPECEGHDHGHATEFAKGMNPECTRELVLDIPAEEVSKAYRTITDNYRKYAKIPGFRAGKVPDSVVRRRFAVEIRKEVIDNLLPERFNKAVTDTGFLPAGQMQVVELTVEDGQSLHVKALFEHVPDFSIEGYQAVTVERPSVELTEEEYQRELEQLRESRVTVEPVEEDRALVDGDWAEISYKGEVESEANASPVTGESALIQVGGKDTVEAFSTALRGAKPGQELKFEVIYPADYAEASLAGKTVAYDVEVKAIKKRIMPELNDDFAKELGHYESLAELEKHVREHMANRKRHSLEGEAKSRLCTALAERYPFAIPESMVQEQIDLRLERGLRALAAQGMDTEQMRKLDFGRLRTSQRDGAIVDAKAAILMDRIAREEKISISDEELDNELQLAAIQAGQSIEALRSQLTEEGRLDNIREQMRREKTASLLYERMPA